MQLINKIRNQPNFKTLIFKIRHHFLYYLRFPNRMMSVPRISMEAELATLIRPLKPGLVLDIGAEDAPYRSLVPALHYVTVDITPGYGANVVSDIANLGCASSVFDTVIATEVLEHCRDPKLAVSELRRVLKHGGVCIISTRFIHPYHPTPQDYYRFTWDSLADIFSQFSQVRIVHHGNTIQSIWALLGTGRLRIVFNLFNPIIARIKTKKTVNPCGFLVYAVK